MEKTKFNKTVNQCSDKERIVPTVLVKEGGEISSGRDIQSEKGRNMKHGVKKGLCCLPLLQ